MNQETQKLVDNFLQSCKSVDIFGYTLGVFIAHKTSEENLTHSFNRQFNKFNESNGIRFEYVNLPNNQVAISER